MGTKSSSSGGIDTLTSQICYFRPLKWGQISTPQSIASFTTTDDGATYTSANTTGTLTIDKSDITPVTVDYAWTRTNGNVTGFALSGAAASSWDWGEDTGGTNETQTDGATSTIYVKHVESGEIIKLDCSVYDNTIGKVIKATPSTTIWTGTNSINYTPAITSGSTGTQDVLITVEGDGIEASGTWRWTAKNNSASADVIQSGAWVGSPTTGLTASTVTAVTQYIYAHQQVTFSYSGADDLTVTASILNISVSGGKV